MRIAFLDSWLQTSAEGSGTAVGIGGLQGALEHQGHQISRLAPLRPVPRSLLLRRLLFNIQLPALVNRLAPAYDLVVGFDIDGWGWTWRGVQSRRPPYIVSVKGVLAEEARYEWGQPRLMLGSLAWLERANVRQADAVLTVSDHSRAAIARFYGVPLSRIHLVPEGIDLAQWPPPTADEQRQRNGKTILCVARQYPRKRIVDLLQAVPLIQAQVPDVQVLIVGDGPEHSRLQQLATELQLSSSVRLLGPLPDDTVRQLYRQADLFCLPSIQEGFGIVFLEAMASGLPIVATTAAAIPEVVPHRQVGLLVPPGNVAALADALVELLSDPTQRQRYSQAGRERVQPYDWDAVATRFLTIVTPLL